MNCERAMNAMRTALDAGRLDAPPSAASVHMEECPRCREAWSELAAMEAALLGGALKGAVVPEDSPSPALRGRLLAALDREPMPAKRAGAATWALRLGAVAAVAALLALGVGLSRRASLDEAEGGQASAPSRSFAASGANRRAAPPVERPAHSQSAPGDSAHSNSAPGDFAPHDSAFASSFPLAFEILETPKRALLAAKEDAQQMARSMWSPAGAAVRAFSPRDAAASRP